MMPCDITVTSCDIVFLSNRILFYSFTRERREREQERRGEGRKERERGEGREGENKKKNTTGRGRERGGRG